jgi:REP element-mobilizing transposase RayT
MTEPLARAKRHFIPDQIWHITHRCHKREFLFRYERLKGLFGAGSYDQLRNSHKGWVTEYLDEGVKTREREDHDV